MRTALIVALLYPLSAAGGIYKCKIDGETVFQSSPCPKGNTPEVVIRPEFSQHEPTGGSLGDAPSAPADQKSQTDVTIRANSYITKREISKREYKIKYTHEREIQKLQDKMKKEITVLKRQKSYANNNLAGAT